MFKKNNRQTIAPLPSRADVPLWVAAIEENRVDDLRDFFQNHNANEIFNGKIGTLQVQGNWSPLSTACYFDKGDCVEMLLHLGADIHLQFHRLGVSFSCLVYCKEKDKDHAYRALHNHLEKMNNQKTI